jgi:hypothetical protein
MKWFYYIPHTWDSPEERTVWEDVWLMPEAMRENEDKVSVWLTVDALGNMPPEDDPEEMEIYRGWLNRLENAEYFIDRDNRQMVVSAGDFNMKEFLEYAKIFLRDVFNEEDIELVEGAYEDFEGTNQHADVLKALEKKIIEERGKGEHKEK